MGFIEGVELVGKVIDGVGVAIIAVGAVVAGGIAVGRLVRRSPDTYRFFRETLGRTILLGLEFLVAADIIRTVAVTPNAQSVAVLAGIVAIRTFLSFSLELEITGRWPWQNKPRVPDDPPSARLMDTNRE
ncbi:hypothetical protein TUM20985_03860 [Mycobacterium antarcticum]|uniref:DUF1622 domain-containing protein n=1 Tax=unclassified Mycolicibacterium TaxID=2636767 RepID=UPI00239AF04D|nr:MULTISPECIES: DUF1622 domain-containing protein [unclassified Mycolicibacterium]BDX29839.1 hypothetical protein TUM20985_03860 [Mycolicibacterium sp. TUM20985]GLP73262.1 hypothetical protein TUM20983_03720 [Mycolicibacterium sp. TUM20983]GLP78976.1 hypothetical protein TUM20984_03960 [Mycolicibacterium sp. TUM20984]